MSYENDIQKNLGNTRNLILLGVRADADIKYAEEKWAEAIAERDKVWREKAEEAISRVQVALDICEREGYYLNVEGHKNTKRELQQLLTDMGEKDG